VRVERSSPFVGFLLWLGLLGAPLAWTAQLVLGYFAEDADCARGSAGWNVSSHAVNGVVFAVVGALVVMTGIGVLSFEACRAG
jgi:hypothetical protein